MYHANWKTLIMPRDVKIVDQSDSGEYARFVCEPLMKGYGITLGNSLRRVLLSSLRGTAVVAIKMKGVEHEFSALPGVRQDVVNVILNLKQVRFVATEDKEHHLVIKKSGKGTITAGDIVETNLLKVLNKDLVIAELDDEADFELEMLVRSGRGYVPSEEWAEDEFSEGFIAIDSFFSPVRRVDFKVTRARVKNNFNFDKLALDVETDGSLDPRDALSYAAMILREHTKFLINFSIDENVAELGSEMGEEVNWNLYKTIDDLDLSVRSHNCLKNANIIYVGELVKRAEGDMLKTKNFGRKSLNEIKLLLKDMGLGFGMEIENFPDQKVLEQIEKKGSK